MEAKDRESWTGNQATVDSTTNITLSRAEVQAPTWGTCTPRWRRGPQWLGRIPVCRELIWELIKDHRFHSYQSYCFQISFLETSNELISNMFKLTFFK